MLKMLTEIIGSRIVLYREQVAIANVADVVIDPADGAFLGVIVTFDKKETGVIPAVEIRGFADKAVFINEISSITKIEDIVRMKAVIDKSIKIIGSRVVTQSGQNLGKALDATVDTNLSILEKLYVNPVPLFSFVASDLIIPAKKIIEIKRKEITVSDEFAKSRSKAIVAMPSVVPE